MAMEKLNHIPVSNQKKFLKTMIDTTTDLIFYKDLNSVYLGCNTTFAQEFIGLTEEGIIGKTDLDFVQDIELAKFFRQKDQEIFQGAITKANEEQITMADGRVIEVETVKTPFYDEQGNVAGLIGISRDITSRKRLEQQLKENQERYAAIVNSAPEFIVIHKDGIINFINDVVVEALKDEKENIIGSHIREFVTLESLERINASLLDKRNGKTNHAYEIELINKYNESMNVLVKGTDISFEGEQATLAVLIDITEKKQAEARLHASEEKFRQLTENIHEVTMVRDKERWLYISSQYEKITGWSSQQLIGKSILAMLEHIYPNDHEKMLEFLVTAGENMDQVSSGEFRFICANGEIKWVWFRGYPIQYKVSDVQLRITSILDITDRKRMEEQLLEREVQTRRELNFAARVQQSSLPQPFAGARVRVSTHFLPYHIVSGDLINYRWFEEQQKLCGYIVDVSGHGVATALQTATVKMLLDSKLLRGKTIDEKDFQFINTKMLQNFYEESFAGLLYFEFSFQMNTLTVISAGINLFLSAKPEDCSLVLVPSCFLGVFDNPTVEKLIMPFKAGEIYCMMSDGVSDLIETHGINKQNSFDEYMAWLEKLAQSPDRSDDFSAVCIEIVQEKKEVKILDITNGKELEQAQHCISEFLERNAPSDAIMLEVAINEAMNNGIRVGGRVRVTIRRVGNRLIIRVKDNGSGFSSEELNNQLKKLKSEEDYNEQFDERLLQENGRGILMMKMLCDRMSYNAKGNEVLLMKKICYHSGILQ